MTPDLRDSLSRLERRIVDALYRLGEAPVADVVSELRQPDAYDSIRVTMANLEKKGFLTHRREGTRNIYAPTVPESTARASALEHLMQTFFSGSPSGAILGLLDMSREDLSDEELAEIRERIAALDAEEQS